MSRLITELKRRNVFRVSIAYLIVAWLVLQLTDVMAPALRLPEWTMSLVAYLGMIGFPFAVVFSWAFELTPEGIKRTADVHPDESVAHKTGTTINRLIIGLMAVAIVGLLADRFLSGSNETAGAVQPSAATGNSVVTASPTIESPKLKSIAVLPFADMSSDKTQEYMSDGLAEEMLNLLAKIPSLRVAARTSAFSFKGEKDTISEIGVKLNVAYVLEGSVRTAGNKIRITAQLIEASTDTHLWSETYTRELNDIFAIQDEIAAEVVNQLQVTLLGELPATQRVNAEAYALYLQARHLWRQGSMEAKWRAVEICREALAIAPDYAPALIGLVYFSPERIHSQEEITQITERALASDPSYGPAVAQLAGLAMGRGDLGGAAQHINHAMALAPNDADVLYWVTQFLGVLERSAVDVNEYNVARDPVNPDAHITLATAYYYAGRFDEAIAAARTALRLSPNTIWAHAWISWSLWEQGKFREALAEAELEPFGQWRLSALITTYHSLGQQEQSDVLLAELIKKYGESAPYMVAEVLAVRGDRDLAFEYLNRSAELAITLNAINMDFSNISDDPRWPDFVARIGRSPQQLAAIEFEWTPPQGAGR